MMGLKILDSCVTVDVRHRHSEAAGLSHHVLVWTWYRYMWSTRPYLLLLSDL